MESGKVEKGSVTEKNLKEAFAGESQAALRYMFYASKAKRDGYEYVADVLNRIAHNEIEHAKIWYKILNSGMSDTLENVRSASDGEKYEWDVMYKNFARQAKEEGYDDIARLFEGVANIEKDHEATYNSIIDFLNDKVMFSSAQERYWVCRNCGHIHFGINPPKNCPICTHPQAFFERRQSVDM